MAGVKPYYSDGNVKIFHGDCEEVMPQISTRFDLLLTDPPYGIGEAAGNNKSRSKLAIAKDYGDHEWDNEPPSSTLIAQSRLKCSHQIIFGGNYFELPPSKCWLIWDKINGKNDFADCELAWTNLDQATRLKRHQWNGMLRKGREKRFHPTQKPLELMSWCIEMAEKKERYIGNILDPWMGVGTTLRAALDRSKKAVGIERDESYCEIAAQRMEQQILDFGETTEESKPPKSAVFSPNRKYRYELWRRWGSGENYCCFIGLNPSTANATVDDPTIRRCIGFAKSWGYDALCMVNLFAYRATDPAEMKAYHHPIGSENDATLERVTKDAGIVVAGWGIHGTHLNRASDVMAKLSGLHCLGVTKSGEPRHPLYLPKIAKPYLFKP